MSAATIRDVLVSLRRTIASDPRDWSVNRRDAWIFGILCGWGDALPEAAEQHGWDEATIERLRGLREAVEKASAGPCPRCHGEGVLAPGLPCPCGIRKAASP